MKRIALFLSLLFFPTVCCFAGVSPGITPTGFCRAPTLPSFVRSSTLNQEQRLQHTNYQALPEGLTYFADFSNGYHDSGNLTALFSNGSALPTFTATRSATAPSTYIDQNGIVQLQTTSGVPRIPGGYYDETGFHPFDSNNRPVRGLMVEGSRTNLQKYGLVDSNVAVDGDDFKYSGTSAWNNTQANGGAVTASVSTDSCSYGGRSMQTKITNAGGGADTDVKFFCYNGFAITNASVYAVSFWVKADAAKTIPCHFIDTTDNTTSRGTFNFTTVADTWIRVENTITASASDTVRLQFNLGNNGLYTIQFESLQVELAPYASSFIPTTTAALTRGAEVLKYLNSGNRTAAQETIVMQFVSPSVFANDSVYRTLLSSDTKNRIVQKGNTSTVLSFFANATDSAGATVSTTTTPQANTSYVVTAEALATTGNPNTQIFIDGTSENINNTDYTSPAWGTYFYIGSNQGTQQWADIVIRKFACFNRPLSSTELARVTALMQQD